MSLRTRIFLAIILFVASAGIAPASPITYTATFTGSGSLDGVSFTNQPVTLTGIGDTTGTSVSTALGELINPVSATVQIGSGSAEAFTDDIAMFTITVGGREGAVGFIDLNEGGEMIEATQETAFLNYQLQSAISGTGLAILSSTAATSPTVAGAFTLDGDISPTEIGTFTATLPPVVTPEPSTFVFLGTGILGLAGAARRRLFNV